MRRHKSKYDIDRMYERYWGIDRPKNVEHTITTYWERYSTNTKEQRNILYELILLEWRLSEKWTLYLN